MPPPAVLTKTEFSSLPASVLDHIMDRLSIPTICILSQSSRSLRQHLLSTSHVFETRLRVFYSAIGKPPTPSRKPEEALKEFKALFSSLIRGYREFRSAGIAGSSRQVAKAAKGNADPGVVAETLTRLKAFCATAPQRDWEKVSLIVQSGIDYYANSLLSLLESHLTNNAGPEGEIHILKCVAALGFLHRSENCVQLLLSKSSLFLDFHVESRLRDFRLDPANPALNQPHFEAISMTIKELFRLTYRELDFYERVMSQPYSLCLRFTEKVCHEVAKFLRVNVPMQGYSNVHVRCMVEIYGSLKTALDRVAKFGSIESLIKFLDKHFASFEHDYPALECMDLESLAKLEISKAVMKMSKASGNGAFQKEKLEILKRTFLRDCSVLLLQGTWHSKEFSDILLDFEYVILDYGRVAIQRAKTMLFRVPKDRDAMIEKIQGVMLKNLKEMCQLLFNSESEKLEGLKSLAGNVDFVSNGSFGPFFSLIFRFDLVLQAIQIFHDHLIAPHIDKEKLVSDSISDKKGLEASVDEMVASGLDLVVQALVKRLESVLDSGRKGSEYNLAAGTVPDLKPTPIIREFVKTLDLYLEVLRDGIDRQHLEVMYTEVGMRVYTMVGDHIKKSQVSESGGFQLMSDLNTIHEWAQKLKSPEAIKMFDLLKDIANLYIIDGDQIQSYLQEDHRFRLLRNEEIVAFLEARVDYHGSIKGRVEAENCIIQ